MNRLARPLLFVALFALIVGCASDVKLRKAPSHFQGKQVLLEAPTDQNDPAEAYARELGVADTLKNAVRKDLISSGMRVLTTCQGAECDKVDSVVRVRAMCPAAATANQQQVQAASTGQQASRQTGQEHAQQAGGAAAQQQKPCGCMQTTVALIRDGEIVSQGHGESCFYPETATRTALNQMFKSSAGSSNTAVADNDASQDEITDPNEAPGEFVPAAPQPNAYALIVGVDRYRDLPAASGARSDAEAFEKLARTTLGIPADHIVTALDERATAGDITKGVRKLAGMVGPSSRIYFFFGGHGSPNVKSGEPYLLPYDADPTALDQTALKLDEVVGKLQESGAKDVLAFVDACFSGTGGRSVLPEGTRPLVPVKAVEAKKGRVAIFSASAASQISGAAEDGGGLFSHYILDGLGSGAADLDGDGIVALSELSQWVTPRVSREAKKQSREQTPTLSTGPDIDAGGWIVTSGLK